NKCQEDYSALEHREHVHLYRNYRIKWGDYRHLLAILLLMNESYKHADLEYFHLITGSDYPCMSKEAFKQFCEKHQGDNYLEHFSLPHDEWGIEGGLNRIKYYWVQPSYRVKHGRLIEKSIKWQRRLGVNRGFKYFNGNLYGGGTYWSVSRKAVKVALDYIEAHPSYLRRFRMTSIAEEICLPTLWCNSGIPLTNNYMRYIDWGSDSANPQTLTEKDYNNIVSSCALFARKMASEVSGKLIEKLDNR
ncbi:MAG: hypothetical protein J5641_04505, partial [Bacteroidales bacterium]|nr:hypothetical protein [Bacteroidales bacterium]